MTDKRKRYTAEFKAKVVLEELRGELATAQLAAKHSIHQAVVGEWKRQAIYAGNPREIQSTRSY